MKDIHADEVRSTLTKAIGTIRLSDYMLFVSDWTDDLAQILATALTLGVVDRTWIMELIHRRIIELGKTCLRQCARGHYADYVSSPEALAYGLVHDVFGEVPEKLIRYDHGDNRSSFIKTYHKPNLPEIIFDQLLPKGS